MNLIYKKRNYEKSIGVLFLLATLSYGIGNQLITQSLKNSNQSTLFIGMGLEVINSLIVCAIGWLSYGLLKTLDKSIIRGYFLSRFTEGILLAIGSLSLIFVSRFDLESIVKFRDYTFALAMLVLGLFSIRYFKHLLKKNIAPRWLLSIGVLGYISLSIYALSFILIGILPMWLFIPGAIFEVVFPIYLIIKGYDLEEKIVGSEGRNK